MELTKEQLELGAKYLATSNTGLLGCGFDIPKTKGEINTIYSQIDYEYENEMGEGLWEELGWWKENLSKVNNNYIKLLKERVPFIFEGK